MVFSFFSFSFDGSAFWRLFCRQRAATVCNTNSAKLLLYVLVVCMCLLLLGYISAGLGVSAYVSGVQKVDYRSRESERKRERKKER